MQHPRSAHRGRVQRAVRVVRGGGMRRRPSPIGAETVSTYDIALDLVRRMRDLFPAFYQKHIAERVITPRALEAAICAFLALVNRDLFEIDDCMELNVPVDPLKALDYTEVGSRDGLLVLEEASYWLSQPRALLYGVGVEGILEDETPQRALTLALWQLGSATNWSIGLDPCVVIGHSFIPKEAEMLIPKLPPLLTGVPMETIADEVDLPGYPYSSRLGELIRYAFGRTGNPMADVTNYEVEVIYGGAVDDTWNDVHFIAENAAEAREIVKLYDQWASAIDDSPDRELTALARALHEAAWRHVPKSNALVDILAEHDTRQALAALDDLELAEVDA